MPVEFRIACLSDVDHRDAAKGLEAALVALLPKSEGFGCGGYSWKREWRDQQLKHPLAWGEWADVVLGLGPRLSYEQMLTWPQVRPWLRDGKTILWLHSPPPDDPAEELSGAGVEVVAREDWSSINSLVDRLRQLASQTLRFRQERAALEQAEADRKADQSEVERLNREWAKSYRVGRSLSNPYADEIVFSKQRSSGRFLHEPRARPILQNNETLESASERWEKGHEQTQQKRWHDLEQSYRVDTPTAVSGAPTPSQSPEMKLVRRTGSKAAPAQAAADSTLSRGVSVSEAVPAPSILRQNGRVR